MSANLWQWLKAFNLFKLDTGERNIGNVARNVGNSMWEKCKANTNSVKLRFAKQVRKYFVNPKTENEGFGKLHYL